MLRRLRNRIRDFKDKSNDTLYVHFPCFDGVVSGALTWDFLVKREKWAIRRAKPINYGIKDMWLETAFEGRTAIVDFLYHPQALFWADHHLTTFISQSTERDFEARKASLPLFYDERSGSTALLLWQYIGTLLSDPPRFLEMVEWAQKIDSASYSSVSEALFGDSDALRINFSLMFHDRNPTAYCNYLVGKLRRRTLRQVANTHHVKRRFDHVRRQIELGLNQLQGRIVLVGNVVAFDVDANTDVITSRYAPYHFFPEADYSLGITRYANSARITAMRNPWREFESVPLGQIFLAYGGGGHQRVASVVLSADRLNEVETIADQILAEVRERSGKGPQSRVEAVLA